MEGDGRRELLAGYPIADDACKAGDADVSCGEEGRGLTLECRLVNAAAVDANEDGTVVGVGVEAAFRLFAIPLYIPNIAAQCCEL